MPELPEVDTICQELAKKLVGKKVLQVWWKKGSRVFRDFSVKEKLLAELEQKPLKTLTRRGKYLLFEFSRDLILVIHLGMTGNLLLEPKEKKPDIHTHLELFFAKIKLSFRDPRTFGRVLLLSSQSPYPFIGLFNLGPEPLTKEFNSSWLRQKLAGRKRPIKTLLMDQSICAGIGNIYADEACFLAGISPFRKGELVKKNEIKKLVHAIKKVLKKAIRSQGTTFRDYRTSFGKNGDYQPLVYGREGEPCLRCGGKILRKSLGNRSSFYCPNCQK